MRFLFLITLIGLTSFSSIVAQSADNTQKTYEIVSADGTRKMVTEEEANAGVSDRLRELREKNQQEKENKRNRKYTLKTISRIGIPLLIVLAGAFITFMRKRKNKKSQQPFPN